MSTDQVYCRETTKSPARFARDLKMLASGSGFLVANEVQMNMADTFRAHGAPVDADFDLHMMQICKPDKAAGSLQANPERAILMPKFVMVFSREETTQIRFHQHCRQTIEALVGDADFPDSLAGTYQKIIAMIDAAA